MSGQCPLPTRDTAILPASRQLYHPPTGNYTSIPTLMQTACYSLGAQNTSTLSPVFNKAVYSASMPFTVMTRLPLTAPVCLISAFAKAYASIDLSFCNVTGVPLTVTWISSSTGVAGCSCWACFAVIFTALCCQQEYWNLLQCHQLSLLPALGPGPLGLPAHRRWRGGEFQLCRPDESGYQADRAGCLSS